MVKKDYYEDDSYGVGDGEDDVNDHGQGDGEAGNDYERQNYHTIQGDRCSVSDGHRLLSALSTEWILDGGGCRWKASCQDDPVQQ